MALEPWQVVYILIALVGLLIGWLLDPRLGIVFIWTLVIALEVLNYRKSRKVAKP
ncbi:MAG: hypothetical protein NZ934_00460 [Hadesarchaea archaeon]|nr:hypothetical protein [Hadesarchaea archaeon]